MLYFLPSLPRPVAGRNDVKSISRSRSKCASTWSRVPILKPYELYADLPENRTIKAYDLREIAVEKLAALTDKARNEPRDLYDLWYLLTYADLSFESSARRAGGKAQNFATGHSRGWQTMLAAKRDRLEKLWTTRLAHPMSELPEFDGVFRTVHRAVREANL